MEQERINCIIELFKDELGNYCEVGKTYFENTQREFNPETFVQKAIDECVSYFGTDKFPKVLTNTTIAEIAHIKYLMFCDKYSDTRGLKSASYTEGEVSRSETYSDEQDHTARIDEILKPYHRFRVVKCG